MSFALLERRYNWYMEFNLSLSVKILHLIDRRDLFKISNLVLGGKVIVTDLYSSLKRQRMRE
jgi:hypothetical protein